MRGRCRRRSAIVIGRRGSQTINLVEVDCVWSDLCLTVFVN